MLYFLMVGRLSPRPAPPLAVPEDIQRRCLGGSPVCKTEHVAIEQ